MPAVKKSEQCTECGDNPRRVRKGKKFLLCEDCRYASVLLRLRVRKTKRVLAGMTGRIVQFNQGEGWRAGYLLKMGDQKASIQPIGVRGKLPDIIGVSLAEIKEEMQSPSCPTVADYYRKYHPGEKVPVLEVEDKQPRIFD